MGHVGRLIVLAETKEFRPNRNKIRGDSRPCVEVTAPKSGRPQIAGTRSLWRVAIAALSPAVSRKGERAHRCFGLKDADGDFEQVCALRARRRLRFRFAALDFLRGLDRLLATADLPRKGGVCHVSSG